MIMGKSYNPIDEANQVYWTIQSLKTLWNSINGADGYYELFAARRMCELVMADEIKNLNEVVAGLVDPEMEIEGYKPIKVPSLAIN